MAVTWTQIRERLQAHAIANGEWAGIPTPVSHSALQVESKYPWKLDGFKLVNDGKDHDSGLLPGEKLRNSFYVWERNCHVMMVEGPDGITRGFKLPLDRPGERIRFMFDTMGVAAEGAWSIEAEDRAMEKLSEMIPEHKFRMYKLTGVFPEKSSRSNVTYLFRRCRPTIATAPAPGGSQEILTCLCLHPIGYYQETWAGVMVPTDCVIAHLCYMRGDERGYWAKANHHCMRDTRSGV
jgi:hypothetical protein